jgi:hypothetical protein
MLPELWQLIFKLLDHDTLIMMERLSKQFSNYTNAPNEIDNLLLKRRIANYPRTSGKYKQHLITFKLLDRFLYKDVSGYISDADNTKILTYMHQYRQDLVKGDWLNNRSILPYGLKLIFDGTRMIYLIHYPTIEASILPEAFDIIHDNITLEYWDDEFEAFCFNHKPFLQQMLDHLTETYDGNFAETTFKHNNNTYHLNLQSRKRLLIEQDYLECINYNNSPFYLQLC